MEENQHTEFKESWHDEYTRYISAFCNTEGGVLYIGIDDKGEVVGIEQPKKLIEKLPNFIAQKTGIMPLIHLREKAGKEYLEIEVQPSAMPISVHGRYYTRSGSVTSELQGNQLNMLFGCENGFDMGKCDRGGFLIGGHRYRYGRTFKLLAKDRVPSIEQANGSAGFDGAVEFDRRRPFQESRCSLVWKECAEICVTSSY